MKRLQEKYGADKLAVLLLSVDKDYLNFGLQSQQVTDRCQSVLKRLKVPAWPNVLMPDGFTTSESLFNLGSYGLTLIDPNGIVRGADLHAEEVEPLMAKGSR